MAGILAEAVLGREKTCGSNLHRGSIFHYICEACVGKFFKKGTLFTAAGQLLVVQMGAQNNSQDDTDKQGC